MEAPAATSPAIGFPTDGRCSYFVEKKKRFCRMVAAAGKRFCGEHAGSAEVRCRPPSLRVAGLWALHPILSPFDRDEPPGSPVLSQGLFFLLILPLVPHPQGK